jgi:hypothetical protein
MTTRRGSLRKYSSGTGEMAALPLGRTHREVPTGQFSHDESVGALPEDELAAVWTIAGPGESTAPIGHVDAEDVPTGPAGTS